MSKNFPVKTVALITFGIDFLGIAIAVSRAIILDRSPMRYFGEGGFMTWISILQLLFIAVLCWKISTLRKTKLKSSAPLKKRPAIFWRVTALGMFFFALDEALEIHEQLDRIILRAFKIPENSLTTRLDDFIILFYAITGLLLIYWYRNEFKHFIASLPWFKWALFFSCWTIFLDMLGHDRGTFAPFADNLDQLNYIHHWFGAVEEMPKILAGGAFLVTFYSCLKIAKKMKQKSNFQTTDTNFKELIKKS
ncbi:conserved membrane hypothetical protein [Hyella patelloides LEGE 07179]|uniref:Integral membrane protein n=1 Tax=Hyella patelloides LEGE 07179 TaxID=945734 RepID=A0A563VJ38_9CYAN|nr:hypothetical protein [Hyella patelloides]VEP11403.1 conserved membrane hypothetical protein [Hyella patelloides LEGE 07179]